MTEWASDIMQLRGGLITIEEYMNRISEKAATNDHFRQDISLTDLSCGVYSETITIQFLNFYNKGAIIAALLDIRLLELSNGKRGLREVFIKLLNEYGKYKPFPDNKFFDIFFASAYPEIEQFINDYNKGTKPLPLKEFLAKIGCSYIAERPSGDPHPVFGLKMGMNDKLELTLIGISAEGRKSGLREGDILFKVLGEVIHMQLARKLLGQISSMKVGEVVVKRGDKEVLIKIPL